ncbi:MAG: nitronate monooxygenase [Saezia sp.]
MMKTKLTELLGIQYPILQGGMVMISTSALASAVSNAGAAGIIGTGGMTSENARKEIKATQKLTTQPFGVNIVLMDSTKEDMVGMVIEEKPAFVTLSAGNPVPYIQKIKDAGIKVIPVVPHLKGALRVEASGADAVIIEGFEAGGHIGTIGCMSLMTNIIPQVKIPVIAAGGIATGRGIVAALAMGATGVQLGSLFMLAKECPMADAAKQKMIEATDTDTIVTGYGKSHAVRGLKNTFSEKFLKLLDEGAPQEELDQLATGTSKKALLDGDIDNGFLLVSSSLNAFNQVGTAQEIINQLIAEANATLAELKQKF